jgi:FKBP-type peptidyl-prolyl cis-trans isomerase FklB
MKACFFSVLIVTVLGSVGLAQDNLPLDNENDRVNYSIGYQIGGDFERQGMKLNSEVLVKGIEDALGGADPLMTPSEMRTTLVELKRRIVAKENEKKKAAAEKNLKDGQAFLAENTKKPGVTTLPSGLQYRIIQEGDGIPPKPTDTVTVHYRGTLLDGTEFDSSYSRNQPATFRADRVIEGWKEALQRMKPGAKYELFIPSNLAYGERGGGGKIGPNSTLIFEVEMLSVQPKEM